MKNRTMLVLVAALISLSAATAFAAGETKVPPIKAPLVHMDWDDPACPDGYAIPMKVAPAIYPYVQRCRGTAWADLRLDPHNAKMAIRQLIEESCMTVEEYFGLDVAIDSDTYAKYAPFFEIVEDDLPGRNYAIEVTCAPDDTGYIGIDPIEPIPAK